MPPTLFAGTGGGVFQSTNAGASWTASSTSLNVRVVAHDPTNAQVVYAGTDAGGVFTSLDGGATFIASNAGLGNRNVRALVPAPTTAGTLYAGTAGGGFFSYPDAYRRGCCGWS